MKSVDVIIPTFDGWDPLRQCLEHLERQTVAHEAIVVDNCSSDGTPQNVKSRFPRATVVALEKNAGYGAAANAGAREGSGDAVVVINNDVFCDPEFLERMVAPLADPQVGMVAGWLLKPGRERMDSAGLEIDTTLAAWNRLRDEPHPVTRPVPERLLGPSGGAAAYRREVFEAVGGFDERLFMYMEDVDLALRIGSAGWLAAEAPDALAVHVGGATAGVRSRFQRFQYGWSRGYMLRKYGVLRRARLALKALVTEGLVVAADALLHRDLAALRGRRSGWRAGPSGASSLPPNLAARVSFLEGMRRRARSARA